MTLNLKLAVNEYNERTGEEMTMADFAKKVYAGTSRKKTTKVQRISNLQNPESGYEVSLTEFVKMVEVLGIDANTFILKYVLK